MRNATIALGLSTLLLSACSREPEKAPTPIELAEDKKNVTQRVDTFKTGVENILKGFNDSTIALNCDLINDSDRSKIQISKERIGDGNVGFLTLKEGLHVIYGKYSENHVAAPGLIVQTTDSDGGSTKGNVLQKCDVIKIS